MNRPSIGRAHLSIGEVLSLLQDEFPDVTISKIRFLESQGLLDPERTPSGYRKFYEYDIERLRWILRLQKDHYLPLKVIKDRLDEAGGIPPADMLEGTPEGDDGGGVVEPAAEAAEAEGSAEANGAGTLFASEAGASGRATDRAGRIAVSERAVRTSAPPAARAQPQPGSGGQSQQRRAAPRQQPQQQPRPASAPQAPAARSGSAAEQRTRAPSTGKPAAQPQQPAARRAQPAPPSASPSRSGTPQRARQPQRPAASRGNPRQASPAARPAVRTDRPRQDPAVGLPGAEGRPLAGVGFEAGADAVSLTLEELAEASGLTVKDIRELERYGLVEPRDGADGTHYDGDALIVARTAAGFLQHGIEARHMRSYKVAVDREAGLFEQIVSPLLKQRNPEARTRATRTVSELIRLGEVMRGVLLRRELRDHIGGA